MLILAGPQVDSLRLGIYSADAVCPGAYMLLEDAKTRALAIRSNPDSCEDIAVDWPNPDERKNGILNEWCDQATGQILQVWSTGSCSALPKITRSPILADLTSCEDGPGWLRIRGGNSSKRFPYAVILDLANDWLWRFGDPKTAVAAAIEYWIDCDVLDPLAHRALEGSKGHRVTRVDVACDHLPAERWTPESYRFFSTRARQTGFEAGVPKMQTQTGQMIPDTPQASAVFGPRSFTLYLGKRGGEGAMLRVYLKTAQLAATAPRNTRSPWFWHPITRIWKKAGWNGKDDVWRAEFEVPARMLHQLDGGCARMSSIQALDVARLWSHCTRTTRHTTTDIGRGDLRFTSQTWQALQNAVANHGKLSRIPSKPEPAGVDLEAVRLVVSKAVSLGCDTHELNGAIQQGMREGLLKQNQRAKAREALPEIEKRHAKINAAGNLWKP